MRTHFWAGCRPGRAYRIHAHCGHGDDPMAPDDGFEGGFGVRRPLRFLAQRLDLNETQVAILARILDELKTERAQAAVDGRRTLAEFADAVSGETFDSAKAQSGGDRRVKSAERLREAVLNALREIHAALTPDQRAKFAYLIRTGALVM